jgi:hypothetical protein
MEYSERHGGATLSSRRRPRCRRARTGRRESAARRGQCRNRLRRRWVGMEKWAMPREPVGPRRPDSRMAAWPVSTTSPQAACHALRPCLARRRHDRRRQAERAVPPLLPRSRPTSTSPRKRSAVSIAGSDGTRTRDRQAGTGSTGTAGCDSQLRARAGISPPSEQAVTGYDRLPPGRACVVRV